MLRFPNLRLAAAVLLLVAAVLVAVSNVLRRSEFNLQMMQRLGGKVTRPEAAFTALVQQFYATNFPIGGLFIHYVGLDPNRDGKFISDQYLQATCTLYPRPVYVALPGTRLDGAAAILAHNQLPDDQWLRAHDVHSVLTFNVADGTPRGVIRRVEDLP